MDRAISFRMELPPFLKPSYWLAMSPPPMVPVVDRVLLVLFAAMVVASVALKVFTLRKGFEKMYRKAMVRTAHAMFWLGLFGLYLSAMNYERVPILSSRFWYVIWAVLFGVAAYRISKYVVKDIPAIRAKEMEREQAGKWLPKSR